MIGIAVACLSFTVVLMSLLRRKRGTLGQWRIPLSLALFISFGWMIYLALTGHLH